MGTPDAYPGQDDTKRSLDEHVPHHLTLRPPPLRIPKRTPQLIHPQPQPQPQLLAQQQQQQLRPQSRTPPQQLQQSIQPIQPTLPKKTPSGGLPATSASHQQQPLLQQHPIQPAPQYYYAPQNQTQREAHITAPVAYSRPVYPPNSPHAYVPFAAAQTQPVYGQPVLAIHDLSDVPAESMQVRCPNCHRVVQSEIEHEAGACTFVAAGLLALVGCWLCAWIPCVMDSCKDVIHICPQCHFEIARKRRL